MTSRIAILAGAGAGVVVAYLTRPARRLGVATEKRRSFIAYLRDHLSAADAAIYVVRRLAATNENTSDRHLFRHLLEELEEDRATVQSLLGHFGASPRSPKRVLTSASGRLVSLATGGAPGDLSLLRTFEALATGIQAKRCMWRTLQELGTAMPAGRATFVELESRALRQWESVEQRRRALAATTFPGLRSVTPSRGV